MIGALATWARSATPNWLLDPQLEGENFIEIVRDIETTVIQVPAGLQDYYGAMYGGLQSLSWGIEKHEHKQLPEQLIPELQKRILLFYSGQSRNSGINNWILFKNFIDRVNSVDIKFQQIASATARLQSALLQAQWTEVGKAIAEEWEIRKTLAAGITTPAMDQAFLEAKKISPLSGKICGAGGGGCFFVYLPSSDEAELLEIKPKIQKIFSDQGIQYLSFNGVSKGLEIKVTCE
jgi:D-glycero-alpha-D-manno-heptose-7-phosphate kinase